MADEETGGGSGQPQAGYRGFPSRMETTADWGTYSVKGRLFEHFQLALNAYYLVCRKKARAAGMSGNPHKIDGADKFMPSDSIEFRAWLPTLFLEIGETKIQYRGEKYKQLLELKDYLTRPEELTYEKAVEYFCVMREFLEDLGITKFEKENVDPRWVVGMEMK